MAVFNAAETTGFAGDSDLTRTPFFTALGGCRFARGMLAQGFADSSFIARLMIRVLYVEPTLQMMVEM
jgi:hypothetical protein